MDIRTIYELLSNSTETPGIVHEIASGRIDADSGMAEGDPDDVDNFLLSITDLAINASEEIDNWLGQKSAAVKALAELEDLLAVFEESCENIEITNKDLADAANHITGLVQGAREFVSSNKNYLPEPEKKFYVYTHSEPGTKKTFYVGKGTGNRAWSNSREDEWHTHVSTIGGSYLVEIVNDNLTESEALELEQELILKMEDQLVNKQKPVGMSF